MSSPAPRETLPARTFSASSLGMYGGAAMAGRASGGSLIAWALRWRLLLVTLMVLLLLCVPYLDSTGGGALQRRADATPRWRKAAVSRFASLLGVTLPRHRRAGDARTGGHGSGDDDPVVMETGDTLFRSEGTEDGKAGADVEPPPQPPTVVAPAISMPGPTSPNELRRLAAEARRAAIFDKRRKPGKQAFVPPSWTPPNSTLGSTDLLGDGPAVAAHRLAAPAPAQLPEECRVTQGWHMDQDRACYFAMLDLYTAETARDPLAPYCFGDSDGSVPLLVHTVVLNTVPPAMALLINSFLATQCCDAELWIWVTAGALAAMEGNKSTPAYPSGHAHRVHWKLLDVDAEFQSLRDDFPDINATAAARMRDFNDVRFQANWARLLVGYK